MTLTDSSDTMTFNLLETPIVDKDIEGAVDNVTLDGNQYTDYLYLKKQYIQKWAIMCPDEYDELRGFYTRQFEEGEIPSYRVYYGANVTKDYIYNGDYFQFNAKGIETGMYLSQLTGNAEQTTYSGKNLCSSTEIPSGAFVYFYFPKSAITAGAYRLSAILNDSTSNNTLSLMVDGTAVSISASMTGSANQRAISGFTLSDSIVQQIQGATTVFLRLYKSGGNFSSVTEAMLEKGTSVTAYEPYVGGTPAPNPQFPQPISTVTGENTVRVEGKNLLNLNNGSLSATSTIQNNTSETHDSNSITITATGTVGAQYWSANTFALDAESTYTISGKAKKIVKGTDGMPRLRIMWRGSNDGGATWTALDDVFYDSNPTQGAEYTFSKSLTGYKIYQFAFYNNLSTPVTIGEKTSYYDLMLELGSTATTYEPYQGQEYEVNLGKNLATSGSAVGGNTLQINLAQQQFKSGTYTLSFIGLADVASATVGIRDNYTAINSNIGTITQETGKRAKVSFIISASAAQALSASANPNITVYKTGSGYTLGDTVEQPQFEIGSQATSFAPYFTPIELAKIGTYQDRIYKDEGKWYLHKETGKHTFTGSESYTKSGYTTTSTWYMFWQTNAYDIYGDNIGFCDFGGVGNRTMMNSQQNGIIYNTASASEIVGTTFVQMQKNLISGWDESLSDSDKIALVKSIILGKSFYYALATPTTTEITDETLLSQLNFIASLYGGVNNISLVGTGAQGEMEVLIRDVLDVERDVVPETPVRLTLTDGGVINACGCRRDVQLTMRETTE